MNAIEQEEAGLMIDLDIEGLNHSPVSSVRHCHDGLVLAAMGT
jgi:hypothetical protein